MFTYIHTYIHKLTLLLLFTFASLSTGTFFTSALAQTPIQCGETKTGFLNIGELHSYTFTANAGDVVNVRMSRTSGVVNPDIRLYAPGGTSPLCEARGNCCNSADEISGCLLPSGGIYTIVATDNGGNHSGDYNLSLACIGVGTPISCGQTVSDTLLIGDLNTYTFTANAGDVVNVRMSRTSGVVNPDIRLYAPGGTSPLCEARGNCCNSADEISGCLLPSGGIYTIVATDNGGNHSGDYNLSLIGCTGGTIPTTTTTTTRTTTTTIRTTTTTTTTRTSTTTTSTRTTTTTSTTRTTTTSTTTTTTRPDSEVCFNGVDDDGDGLVDCNDPDCACDQICQTSEWTPTNYRSSSLIQFNLQRTSRDRALLRLCVDKCLCEALNEGVEEIVLWIDECRQVTIPGSRLIRRGTIFTASSARGEKPGYSLKIDCGATRLWLELRLFDADLKNCVSNPVETCVSIANGPCLCAEDTFIEGRDRSGRLIKLTLTAPKTCSQ